MTYFRPHACWKSGVTNRELGVIHRSVDGTNPGTEPDFFPVLMRLAIAEMQPIERPGVRRREPRFDGQSIPKLVLNTRNCKCCDRWIQSKPACAMPGRQCYRTWVRALPCGLACTRICGIFFVLLNLSRLGFFGDRLLGGLLFILGAPPFCSHWQV